MEIKELVGSLFSGKEKIGYNWKADNEGLNYFVPTSTTQKINQGQANLWVSQQHIALRMLVEQEDAEEIPNGFIIPTSKAVQLDEITREILVLPPQWSGTIEADIKGTTGKSNFSVVLKVETNTGNLSRSYKIVGPVLRFSKTQEFILTPAQQIIFASIQQHKASDKAEYDNLLLVLALQEAQKAGADIHLSHFEKLNIKAPESISIEAELDDNGNLILTPFMGQDASHEKIQKVLGQLRTKHATSLRVNDEIILFDEKKLNAVHEILKSREVLKKDVKQFLENPAAFIDATFVDLDIGFSMRVHGATKFKHAYFGETDESGIDWFGGGVKALSVLPINKLVSYLSDWDKFSQFEIKLENALQTGADEVSFERKLFDISDPVVVNETVERIKEKLKNGEEPSDSSEDEGETEAPTNEPDEDKDPDTAVVDVDLNDEYAERSSPTLEQSISEILYPIEKLDWTNYSRIPFPHQYIGIQWILGLATAKEQFEGGLLADDMGLGKTLMALSAVDHLYKLNHQENKTKKPCLVVAPLSLLQNWKDEVDKTFSSSPFKDIIILQSNADLPNFRVGKPETKQQKIEDDSIAEIRYSLKVGSNFTVDRLDQSQRLVITTYQTLRDYQFSLCSIDWGMVIFDEAQNIKNPNTLQTRAAKGLKSDFKLLATGTPVENKLTDFWCLMDTATPSYLDSYQDFRERYITPILHAAGDEIEEVRGQIGRELRLKVGPLMLRRMKEDNLEGLPEKRIFVGIEDNNWEFKPLLKEVMSGKQLDIYNATINLHKNTETNMVLAILHRLKDISLHPQLADAGRLHLPNKDRGIKVLFNESGKLQSLFSILDEIKKRKEKCIIFAINKNFQRSLSLALGRLYGLGIISIINGDTKAVSNRKSTPTRKTIIQDFEGIKGFNIIIMSPVAAGVGLTIIGANNVIHLERHWNPAKEAQATDRVYRIGQKKNVNVYIPILHHPVQESFDVNLHQLLSKKTLLKDAVVTPEQVVPNPQGFNDRMEPSHRVKPDDLHELSWQQFEALCAELFAQEYVSSSCWLTKSGSDYGADIALIVKESVSLVQCKHTKTGRYDGYKSIQEVQGASIKYSEELSKGIDTLVFATNAKQLSSKTRKIAKQYQVEIFSFNEISLLLDNHLVTFEMVLNRLGKSRLEV